MCAAWENKTTFLKIDPAGFLLTCAVATSLTTVLLYAGWFFSGPWIDVMELLSRFVLHDGMTSHWIGGLLLLPVGLISTTGYIVTWKFGILRPGLHTGIIMGLLHGLAAVITLQVLYALVPNPPAIYMTLGKTIVTIVAHTVFGLTTAALYRPFFTLR